MRIVFRIAVLFVLILMISCQPMTDTTKDKAALFETDRLFAQASVEKGAAEAFRMYLAEDAMQLPAGSEPVFSRDSIYENMLDMPRGAVLEWEPQDGEVAQSGEMGWTWGNYVFTRTNEQGEEINSYGKYLNIWEKQEDGQWRVLIDMGNMSPEPE